MPQALQSNAGDKKRATSARALSITTELLLRSRLRPSRTRAIRSGLCSPVPRSRHHPGHHSKALNRAASCSTKPLLQRTRRLRSRLHNWPDQQSLSPGTQRTAEPCASSARQSKCSLEGFTARSQDRVAMTGPGPSARCCGKTRPLITFCRDFAIRWVVFLKRLYSH